MTENTEIQGFWDTLPIPSGVEFLMEDRDISERIRYIRSTVKGVTPELKRLVAEESRRELTRLGVIK